MPIHKIKRFVKRNPNMALGLQVAMTILAHNKGAAAGMYNAPNSGVVVASLGQKIVPKHLKEKAEQTLNQTGHSVDEVVSAVWDVAKSTSQADFQQQQAPPMTYEQARLWLQSYNAGPYATLKHKGTVPYRETMNYVPRVMKYYKQDLSKSPYDAYIRSAAAKYGLDPQLVRAVMKTESDFNNRTVSHAGARGLMQVMPVVWKDVMKRYNMGWEYDTGVFDPAQNIEVACAYLAWLRYDFLPRHFASFQGDAPIPVAMIRDKAPPRATAKIVTEVASAAAQEHDAALSSKPTVAVQMASLENSPPRTTDVRPGSSAPSASPTIEKGSPAKAGPAVQTATARPKAKPQVTVRPSGSGAGTASGGTAGADAPKTKATVGNPAFVRSARSVSSPAKPAASVAPVRPAIHSSAPAKPGTPTTIRMPAGQAAPVIAQPATSTRTGFPSPSASLSARANADTKKTLTSAANEARVRDALLQLKKRPSHSL